MDIKAGDVKALREKTGAGMMDCKNALVEAKGDFAEAEKLLKEQGRAAMEKRAARVTAEGRIAAKIEGDKAVIAELNCETDFVAKNADFIALTDKIVETALEKNYTAVTEEISAMVSDLAAKIRENMSARRLTFIKTSANEYCAKYVHFDAKSGVLVVIKAENPGALENQLVKDFAYDCCLHYAAFSPQYVRRSDVSEAYIAEQKEIFTKQVEELDKPEKVKEGIIQGKLSKHLADICFLDQPFVKDDKTTVGKKLDEISRQAGSKLEISQVVYYQLGV